jgi:hypothetical protein
VGTIGAFGIAASILVFIWNLRISLKNGLRSGDDPWDGATLEWTTPSPPPHFNFATLPAVTSARPLWDTKYGMGHGAHGAPVATEHEHPALAPQAVAVAEHEPEPHAHDAHDDEHGHHPHIHMPDPSYWPMLAALGLSIFFGGLLIGIWLSILGVALMVISIYAWSLEPVAEEA